MVDVIGDWRSTFRLSAGRVGATLFTSDSVVTCSSLLFSSRCRLQHQTIDSGQQEQRVPAVSTGSMCFNPNRTLYLWSWCLWWSRIIGRQHLVIFLSTTNTLKTHCRGVHAILATYGQRLSIQPECYSRYQPLWSGYQSPLQIARGP